MAASLSIALKRAPFSDKIFVGQVVLEAEIIYIQHNIGTVRCLIVVCVNGIPCLKMVTQVSQIVNSLYTRPFADENIERFYIMILSIQWASVDLKWPIICMLVTVLPMKSFTTDLALIQFVQYEFQTTHTRAQMEPINNLLHCFGLPL
jgi:hypothetical protein